MRRGHPEVCLYQPEIPQNTGNIARLTAATQCRLHLIRPLGFSMDEKNLRRPGLDYWPFVDLEIHKNIESLIANRSAVFLTKKAQKPYWEIPRDTEVLVFGRETSGLPESLLTKHADCCYGLPMLHPGVRSLNLANAVAVVLYDQLRQRDAFF